MLQTPNQSLLRTASGCGGCTAYRGAIPVLVCFSLACISALLLMPSDYGHLLAPVLVLLGILLWLVLTIRERDGAYPVCDVGSICALATVVYSVVPVLNYIAGGLQFTALSDLRLYLLQPTPFELGMFHWWHVAYLLSFAVVYVLARGSTPGRREALQGPDAVSRQCIIILLVSLIGYFFLSKTIAGVDYHPSYEDMRARLAHGIQVELPLIFKQVSNKLPGWLFVCKLALLTMMVARFRRLKWRLALYLWLGAEVLLCVARMGARTQTVLLLMAMAILYHRLVKPLSPRFCAISGSLLLAGFFAFGWVRDGLLHEADRHPKVSIMSAANEYQALLGTGYDLRRRVEEGLKPPLQVYYAEFLQLIPQQMYPVKKIDPSLWYLEVLGDSSGSGLMFGVMGQAAVGFGIWELVLRGGLLGFILARIHRWYFLRRSSSFSATLFYVWLCTNVYYTFRGSTFYLVTPAVHQLLPLLFVIQLASVVSSFSRDPCRHWARTTSFQGNLHVRNLRED